MNEQLLTLIENLEGVNNTNEELIAELTENIHLLKEDIKKNQKKITTLKSMLEDE